MGVFLWKFHNVVVFLQNSHLIEVYYVDSCGQMKLKYVQLKNVYYMTTQFFIQSPTILQVGYEKFPNYSDTYFRYLNCILNMLLYELPCL